MGCNGAAVLQLDAHELTRLVIAASTLGQGVCRDAVDAGYDNGPAVRRSLGCFRRCTVLPHAFPLILAAGKARSQLQIEARKSLGEP